MMDDMDDNAGVMLGKIVAQIDNLERGITDLRSEVREHLVTRREWQERNSAIDRELKDLKGKRAPWWSVVTAVAALAGIGWSIFVTIVELS